MTLALLAVGASYVWYTHSRKKSSVSRIAAFFRGKRVLVTGCSPGGIGEELAKQLYQAGACVILSARNSSKLNQTVDSLKSLSESKSSSDNSNIHTLLADLTDPVSVETLAQESVRIAGPGGLDVIIHNAGRSVRGAAIDTTPQVDRELMEINYFAPIALTKAIVPSMIEAGKGGSIIVVSSLQGKFAVPMRTAYSAPKHALHGFFDALRHELVAHDIGVTLCCPGYVATNLSLNAATGDGTSYGTMDDNTAQGLSPQECARQILDAAANKQHEAIIAKKFSHRLAVRLKAIAPWLLFSILQKRYNKEQANV
jgi:dehydrogenase/reductase SDR family member 7B